MINIRMPKEFCFTGLGCGQPAIAIAVKPLEVLGHTTAGFGAWLLCGKRHVDNGHGDTPLKTHRSHDLPSLPPNVKVEQLATTKLTMPQDAAASLLERLVRPESRVRQTRDVFFLVALLGSQVLDPCPYAILVNHR
jgi:hypothetical protein